VIEEGSEVLDGRKMVLYLSYPLDDVDLLRE
jgi:hypothetical protein